MPSLRRRVTVWYAVALGATVLVFGTALYVERRQSSVREIDQRLFIEADFARRWLNESYRVYAGQVIRGGEGRELEQAIAANFEGVRDFLVVSDRRGDYLYLNEPTRRLNFAAVEALTALLTPPPAATDSGTIVDPVEGNLRFLRMPIADAGPEVGAVLVAARTSDVSFGPEDLLRSMLLIGPVILLGSIAVGYFLAGRALAPLRAMRDELEAITDGRSLHRRLAVPMSGDEFARLAVTVNATIARLERSFASLRRFTADASHELKTPLMVLRAGVERALTQPGIPAESLEGLDQSLDHLNQMSELVDNLLMLARADEGRATLAVEPCDLRALVADTGETAEMLGEAAGVRVTVDVPPDPVMLPVDASRIRQLLLNLVTNAVKYTPNGGEVGLALADLGHELVITVRDTGVGIAAGDLPHIFDRFYRADPARSRAGDRPGTGLGLAITKWIAEAHGGEIAVQSRPGRGTAFTVRLPRPPGPA